MMNEMRKTRKLRKTVILTASLAALLLVGLAAGCSSVGSASWANLGDAASEADYSAYGSDTARTETSYTMPTENDSDTAYDVASDTAYDAAYDGAEEASTEGNTSDSSGGSGSLGSSSDLQATDSSRKLIRYQYLTLETRKFDEVTEWIQNQVKTVGGYVESSNISGSADSAAARYASYTLRVPSDGLDDFTEALKQEGSVTSFSENVEDVTLNYTDTESHISALKTEQETLMEMLSQSGDLDTLLAIQERLTDIRYQLENYESQLRLYDNEIDYSTIYVTLNEVEREKAVEDTSFGSKLKESVSSGFYNFGKGFQAFLLGFVGLLPLWILLIAVASITLAVCRRIRRRKKAPDQGHVTRRGGSREDRGDEEKRE